MVKKKNQAAFSTTKFGLFLLFIIYYLHLLLHIHKDFISNTFL